MRRRARYGKRRFWQCCFALDVARRSVANGACGNRATRIESASDPSGRRRCRRDPMMGSRQREIRRGRIKKRVVLACTNPRTAHIIVGADILGRNYRAQQICKKRRPVGGNRAPACQKRLGKSGAVGETGPFSERTLVLSASEAPIAGREPSRVGSETTQTHCPKSALAETPLCTICWRDGNAIP